MNTTPQTQAMHLNSPLHGITEVSPDLRTSCEEEVIALNLSKLDLFDPSTAIAVMTSKAWARADAHVLRDLFNDRPITADQFIVAGMRHDDGAADPILECAIQNLPALIPHHGAEVLQTIGKLIEIFGRYTHSVPLGWTMDAWRKAMHDISQALIQESLLISHDKSHDRFRIDTALGLLIENFENLWD